MIALIIGLSSSTSSWQLPDTLRASELLSAWKVNKFAVLALVAVLYVSGNDLCCLCHPDPDLPILFPT
jgi:hypothetical protein